MSNFVPFESLTQRVVNSIISIATTFRKPNFDYSQRTILIFLLEIRKKLSEIEKKNETDQHTKNVRQWLAEKKNQPLNWIELEKKYKSIADQKCNEMARYYKSDHAEPYFELQTPTVSK